LSSRTTEELQRHLQKLTLAGIQVHSSRAAGWRTPIKKSFHYHERLWASCSVHTRAVPLSPSTIICYWPKIWCSAAAKAS